MKRFFTLMLALLAFLLSTSQAESKELELLRAENAELRAQVEKLTERLLLYADPTVIAVFDGGCVTYDDIAGELQTCLSFSSLFGTDIAENPEELFALQMSLIDEVINARLVVAHTEGLALSPEREEQALREADEAYENLLGEMMAEYDGDAALAEAALVEVGSDRESLRALYLDETGKNAAFETLTSFVSVSEEEVRAYYEEKLNRDREYYAANPDEYVWDRNFTLVLWIPEGYRIARILTVPFTEDQQRQYDEILCRYYECVDEAQWPAFIDQLEALHAQLLPAAEAVRARLDEGETFDALGMEYSIETELICSDSWAFDTEEFMTLTAPGEVTSPTPCDAGYMLIEYFSPVEAGPVAYEEVYEEMSRLALQQKRQTAYAELLSQWRAEAGIEYLTQRLNG